MKNCKYCNKEFQGQAKYFCSPDCFYNSKRKSSGKLGDRFCKVCNKLLKYYQQNYCSRGCFNSCEDRLLRLSQARKGTKQTAETIEKRLANTDQIAKEQKRKLTCLAKFGEDNVWKLDEYRENFPPTPTKITAAQRLLMTQARKDQGKYKVSDETRLKISVGLKKTFSDPDFDRSVFLKGRRFSYVNGYVGELYYRSSYELEFINKCISEGINIVSAENNNYAVDYTNVKGEKSKYYPDFYLPDFDLIVEVKPKSMLQYKNNPMKIAAAKIRFDNFLVLTENDIFGKNKIKEILNEYLCQL